MLFIDESGDPGSDMQGGSSRYFAMGCLHLTDVSLDALHKHYCAFEYFQARVREIKSSKLSRLQKDQISDMFKWMSGTNGISTTVAFIDKQRYTGPFLNVGVPQAGEARRFRDFLARLMFERHFAKYPPQTLETELVFDQAIHESEEASLRAYLRGNMLLPRLDRVSQCDSRYVPALQFIDVLVHFVKEIYFGDAASVDARVLDFIDVVDVSNPTKRTTK